MNFYAYTWCAFDNQLKILESSLLISFQGYYHLASPGFEIFRSLCWPKFSFLKENLNFLSHRDARVITYLNGFISSKTTFIMLAAITKCPFYRAPEKCVTGYPERCRLSMRQSCRALRYVKKENLAEYAQSANLTVCFYVI